MRVRRPLFRHALIHVEAAAWATELAAWPALRDDTLIAGWAPAWPLMARRRDARDRPGRVPLGLPLPPHRGKRRIAVDLEPGAIAAVAPPPRLDEARAVAPLAWHATIDAILALAHHHATTPRVFGSFAWARLTGLAYIGPSSDLDLLWPLVPGIEAILAAVSAIERAAPGKLDGEVVRESDGGAVNWRELASEDEVLVKTIDGVALESAQAFLRDV